MATCKAFLKDKNKNNEYKVWVKYTHQSAWKPFSTGITILPEHFDKEDGRVLESHPNHTPFNAIIHALSSHLLSLAKTLESKFTKPSPDNVRLLYDENPFIHNKRTLKQQEEKRKETESKGKKTVKSRYRNLKPIKDMSLKEFLRTDIDSQWHKKLMQKHGEPTVIQDIHGNDHIVTQIYALDYIRILTPQFKSNDTRMAYLDFKRYADIFIEESTDISESTRKQRRSWLNTILEFSLQTDIALTWDNFNQDFYKSYGRWLMYGKRDGINENDLYNNSFGSHVKRLTTFLGWCEKECDITVNERYKDYKVLSEEKEIISLDPQEINMLWEYQMPEVKGLENKPWRLVQDIAVFGTLTGLRISDIKRSRFNLDILKRDKALEAKTLKNKGNYYIPLQLDSRIELILKKYEYNLNIIQEQEFNKLIKVVLKHMNQHHDIHQTPITFYRYKFREEFKFERLKHDLYSSHSNRRSAVTNWHFELGLSEQEILVILGSKSITELKKYISKNPFKVKESVLRKVREHQDSTNTNL
ncbi:hypothetical protein [Rufibacter sp. LB8]|uniref:hypothetical protein n=1 Tax=Rufibacter sp. LB8 TaxID=2777781 RepID=UPI00178C36A6|nr:hypothetical protein [Rufibacter sp. LB8]